MRFFIQKGVTMCHSFFYVVISWLLIVPMSTHATIATPSSVEQFEQEIRTNETPVIVKFEASWCGACNMISAPFKEVLGLPEFSHIKAIIVDIDKFPEIAQKHHITAIPTIEYFAPGGKSAGVMLGVQNVEKFKDQFAQELRTKFGPQAPTQEMAVTKKQDELAQGPETTEPSAQKDAEAELKPTSEPTPAETGFFAGIIKSIRSTVIAIINWIKSIFGY
jgi:thioredoxin-like negative regulator of GroEL